MNRRTKIALIISGIVLVFVISYTILNKVRHPQRAKESEYYSAIEFDKTAYTTSIGERIEVPLRLTNKGRATWIPDGKFPYFLSYHLMDEKGQILRFDNRRFSLSKRVYAGQKIDLIIPLRSPLEPGEYHLEFDLLREGLFWFKDRGSPTSKVKLSVKDRKWPEDDFTLGLDYETYTRFSSDFKELHTIHDLIRITLEKNLVEFMGKTGKIQGFSAGTGYPQIWLRDSNSGLGAAKYFYSTNYLSTWLEEILAHQQQNGSLNDWINKQGRVDKNTTETDQEANAIQTAFKICEMIGVEWLNKEIANLKMIDRLEKALAYVFEERFNSDYGLIMGAHTADWGDVDMVDVDREAVYVDEKTHWTSDIYDQSMVYEACLSLSEMFSSMGIKEKAIFWRERAGILKTKTNEWLWQPEKGFYKVHIHLDDMTHTFEEDDILALGGNTQAILSGLTNERQTRQIIANVLERQKALNISTISGTLLPPYPRKTFKHPLVDDLYEYQNGAQWDWFGGRFIYALFTNGFSRLAKEKMKEIFQKNISNKSFFEWDNREGVGLGSEYFLGSAGSLGRAIFEGYFGIKLRKDLLSIEPKLGQDKTTIHVYIPANDTFVAYDYTFEQTTDKLVLKFNSNFPHEGTIKILSPWPQLNRGSQPIEDLCAVFMDGDEKSFHTEKINEDVFIVFTTDFKNHTAEILLNPD
jgi:hypothetical protein